MNSKFIVAVLALAVLSVANQALAADAASTVITVGQMHCAGCAKKIAAKLYEVRGVAEVRYHVKSKTLQVTPQRNGALSPRALWIAVEKAKNQPIRLAGPSGTFTSRPRFKM